MHKYNDVDHPDIDKCAGLLKVYENTSNNAYINAKKSNARGPKTNLPVVLRDDRLRGYQRAHRKWISTNGQVGSNLATYKEDVLYHYAYAPPKASAGRQLYETDDSDHESDSENELPSLAEDGPEEAGAPVASLAVVTRVFANRYATSDHVQNRILNIRPSVGEVVATQSVVPRRVGTQLKNTRDLGKVRCDICNGPKSYENTNRGIGRHKISCRLKNVVEHSGDSDESEDDSIPSVSPPNKRPRTMRGAVLSLTSDDDDSEVAAAVLPTNVAVQAVDDTDSEREVFVRKRNNKRFSFARKIIEDSDDNDNSE
jgi:hypothetical protein